MSNVTERFRRLFRGFDGAHGRSRETGEVRARDGKKEAKSRTVRGPVPDTAWAEHLSASGDGLGRIMLDEDSNVSFAVLDIDIYNLEIQKVAANLANTPVVPCESKSGGVHIYAFFEEPLPAEFVVERLGYLAQRLGVAGCEIFPKQIKRTSDDDAGNWINLPYYGDTRHAVKPDGSRMALEEFLDRAEQCLISYDMLESLMPSERIEAADENAAYFYDGPPCLRTIMQQIMGGAPIPGDGRNVLLFNCGVYAAKKYGPGTPEFVEFLQRINATFPKPLDDKELQATIERTHQRREYRYQCKSSTLRPFCKSQECAKTAYGIEDRDVGESAGITVANATKVMTAPVYWFVDVNNIRIRFPRTEDLLNIAGFQKLVLEQAGILVPTIKKSDFELFMKPHLEKAEVVHVDEHIAGEHTDLRDTFVSYIERNAQAQDPQLIQQGRPYREADLITFRMADFKRHCREQRLAASGSNIYSMLTANFEMKAATEGVISIVMPERRKDIETPKIAKPFEGKEAE